MKSYIIPIFIPHYGCKHACVFCNQYKITGGRADVTAEFVQSTIAEHLARIQRERFIEVAFYGGSFTALPLPLQCQFLAVAYAFLKQGKIHAVRISTRPDCIDMEILKNLIDYGVQTIELGAQSFDAKVLSAARRGHTSDDIVNAVRCIRQTDLKLGIQLMPGLPEDTWKSQMSTLSETIALCPDFVRIYPTIVLQNTQLAKLFIEGTYVPLSLEEAVRYCAVMKIAFEQNDIQVIRTGLQATEQLDSLGSVLSGPYHPAFGELVDAYIFRLMLCQFFEQISVNKRTVILHHAPKDASKIRGNKNTNVRVWQETYQMERLFFQADLRKAGQVIVECGLHSFLLDRNIIRHI